MKQAFKSLLVAGLVLTGASLTAASLTSARAEPLRIGIGGAFTSIDPHFYNATPNHSVSMHIFDRLVDRAPDVSLKPGLALSWKTLSDTVWEFKLRPGVTWHDGKPFTADDVAFTYERARNVPNSPGGFGGFLRAVKKVEVVDPLTLRIDTGVPAPNLPRELAFVPIISRHVGETAATEDYNSGKAAIGTGPYKFVSYTPGDRVELTRNDAWWGAKQPWDKVTLRMITNPGARVASILAGDVDVIDTPPAGDLAKLRADDRVRVASTEGLRVIYLALHSQEPVPATITANDGKPLAKNPLLDVKVRQALSIAINREGLADRIMHKTARATGQWLPPGTYSYATSVAVPAFDTNKAKALLAEAGFPDGFKVTLFSPSDRYPNDAATAQAIAQMWTRAGVKTAVETLPWSAYTGRGGKQEFGIGLWGWGSPTGEAGYLLSNVAATNDAARGLGVFNYGRYSNPELDKQIVEALATIDDDKREKLFVSAIEIFAKTLPIIPLYTLDNAWVTRKGITIEPRRDERTLAVDARPAK
ncbi:ABC transporter substrate-binding protein [Bosea sp. Root381]|uniref:ABC transporter substrate-binding protein n=1 Tax=Bosea sp. Root381 TaxID=1736524 RepID=UPI0006FE13A6|nr:ABC transporter substrate-binding protein [Bosea sp. Root381]KRD96312.1 ABC transporter substrate-binding protein [Bosea sp. Root381]